MAWVFTAAGLLACLASVALVRRLARADRQVGLAFDALPAPDPVANSVRRVVQGVIDETVLGATGPGGLGAVDVRYRESRDPYRTVPELISHIISISRSERYCDLVELIKMVYQLQDSLLLPTDRFVHTLTELANRLKASSGAPRRVGGVEFVAPGALLDTSRMVYLNSGTHVRQPFGVVIVDTDGVVMSKAKVICS